MDDEGGLRVEDESGSEEKRRKRRGVCCVSSGERGGERIAMRCLLNTNGLLVSGRGCLSLASAGPEFYRRVSGTGWDWVPP